MIPTCTTCNDTRRASNGYMCTSCPIPCDRCRYAGNGPFCSEIPCGCGCHRKSVEPEPELSYRCSTCGFKLFNPIAELEVSILGLYNDARFPGRSLLVFKDHYGDFTMMPSGKATAAFTQDMQRAGRAIHDAVGARRMNYAILGNVEPHVHAHLIPRTADDPIPNRAPWAHPDEVTPLSANTLAELGRKIVQILGKR